MPNCYYYDEQRNHCKCYVNENLNELLAENVKLREDLEDQEAYDQMLRDRLRQQTELCVKAEAENAKLRELVKDIDEVADPFLWEFIGRRMRELGVEVD